MNMSTPPAESPLEILIAEDSPTQSRNLQHILERAGYRVVATANGREALAAVRRRKPVIVISDVVMPEMDGYELCRQIKGDAATAEVPVILVTTMSEPQDVIRGLECGADNFILKPYDRDYLLNRLRFVILNREMRQTDRAGMGVQIVFNGEEHFIVADRLQILNLLLSTYEAAMHRNKELIRAEDRIREMNRELESLVARRTQQLRESEEQFRLMVESVKDYAILMLDPDGRVMSWNSGAERLMGYRADEITGKHLSTFYPPEQVAEKSPDHELRMAREHGRFAELGWRIRRDGSRFWANVITNAVRDETGRLRGFVKVTCDLTEQRRAEEAIRELNAGLERRVQERTAQLEEANRELESFSYSVSHDLRAPLRHVQGYIEMLGRELKDPLPERAGRYLRTIGEAAHSMGELIDDLLAFSRMGRTEMQERAVDLGRLVEEVRAGLGMPDKGREIQWKIGPLPAVLGDLPLLRQAFVNLLDNAVKYSRQRDPAVIEVGCAGEEDGRAIVFVRDNGAGFDMKYADKLFGVFQRLHRTDEFEGTGIGLANVRRIVARHGGRTWAEGAVGAGATFFFTLKPAAARGATPPQT